MMPIWLGRTPALKNRVTIFSTLDASVLRARGRRQRALGKRDVGEREGERERRTG